MKPRPGSSKKIPIQKSINHAKPIEKASQKSIKLAGTSGKNITKQIDKLMKQIEITNEDIKQTEKFLDVDLFMKEQKKKKQQYAKNLNAVYQTQKKLREEKLYKKHNREKKKQTGSNSQMEFGLEEPQGDNIANDGKQQKNTTNPLLFMKSNMAVFNPTMIIKSLTNQHSFKNSQWIRPGHIFKDQQCGDLQALRKDQEKMFQKLYRDKKQFNSKKYDGDIESKHISWKNIKQVCQNNLQLKTMPTIVQQHQFLVGASENQQILNALTFMTEDISEVLFAETQNTFSAKLNTPSKQVTVVIDKNILVRQFTHKNVNLGARCQNSNFMWPTLVEKCLMKLEALNGYEPGNPRSTLLQSIFSIYGLDAEIVPITNENIIKQNFPLVLGHLLQEGRICFMNVGRAKKSSYQNRLYMLQWVREEVVHQSNDEVKKQIFYKIRDPWRGKLLDSQNRNKFNILELLGHFNVMVILKEYPQKWSCLRINFSYFSNGAIGLSNNQWTKNPQYLFTITKKMSIRIILRKSSRSLEEKPESSEGQIFGFLLFQNKEADNKIQCMKMDALIKKTKSNDLNEASHSCDLNPGNYIVIPYNNQKSQKAYQFFTFDFIVERQSSIDFGKARIHEWEYAAQKGSRLTGQKIIQSLESKQKFERPKSQKITMPKLFRPKIAKKILESLGLNLYEKCEYKHFYMPGFIRNLIINTAIDVESKMINKNIKNSNKNQNTHEELNQQQKAQNLSILLGYDAISDEVNQGKMKEYIEQSVGYYDFRDYGLGQEGLVPILESLSQHPQIISLDLIGNQLNDAAITYLCYYLEKSSRVQIRQIKLEKNRIGFNGKNALKGLKIVYPKIKITATGFKIQ